MTPSSRSFWLAAVLACLVAGCSGGPQCVVDTHCDLGERCQDKKCVPLGGRDGGPDGGPADTGPDGPVDAGDAGPRDTGPPDTGPIGRGSVVAHTDQLGIGGAEGVPQYNVTAAFAPLEPEEAGPCTTTALDDHCRVTICRDTTVPPSDAGMPDAGPPEPDAGPGDAGMEPDTGPPVQPNAGTITVTGGIVPLTLLPSAEGFYSPEAGALLLWTDATTTMQFSGEGADVPAFSVMARSVTSATLTSPDLGTTAVIDRAADMPLAWTTDSQGELRVTIAWGAAPPSTESRVVACGFPAADLAGTIPQSALAMLPAASSGTFSMTTVNALMAPTTAPWEVEIQLRADGALPSGQKATLPVSF